MQSAISICLRKRTSTSLATTADLLDDNYAAATVNDDAGYLILKGLCSSLAHWDGEKKKIIAMIRQVGLPTYTLPKRSGQNCL